MASKKKLLKGIKSISQKISEHEKKLASPKYTEALSYLIKDIDRLKKQKEQKEKRLV